MNPLLVITAVPAEAHAIRAGLTGDEVTVAAVGVGPALAAAATARRCDSTENSSAIARLIPAFLAVYSA